jgi:putative ABC transport system substrate-binding protein
MQLDQLKCRDFMTRLGGAAASPLAARAQQATKLPTIGYLGSATLATESQRMAAFVQRLRELGWIEGRTVVVEIIVGPRAAPSAMPRSRPHLSDSRSM